MKHIESSIQRGFVKAFRHQYAGFSCLLFAIPNGGARNKIEASIMQGEGVLAGAADLMLAIPAGGAHGLFLECKSPTGKQTDTQRKFQHEVEIQGYQYRVFRSAQEGLDIVRQYLKS